MNKEFFGVGCIKKLDELINNFDAKRIFLVCGKKSFVLSGAKEKILPYLHNKVYKIFNPTPNPTYEIIVEGIKIYNKFKPDLVIAVGGGSVIDSAKIINALANQKNIFSYIIGKKNIKQEINPLIAIPTTAGSGSEVTKFATIYIKKKKYSLENEKILPTVAIVDPSLTFSLPPYITAYTGLDALCQAIESYWAINSTERSRKYAREAMKLAYKNIKDATKNKEDARIAMSRAAFLSGKAINISKTTACHSISYPLTAYFNIPHGHAVALSMPEFLEFNFKIDENSCNDARGVEFVKKRLTEIFSIFGFKNEKDANEKFRELLNKITGKAKLREFGIKREDLKLILNESFTPNRMNNNPRKVDRQNLKIILKNMW